MKKIRTGLFFGSFNPIHIGHLSLANYLLEFEGLDEIWFVLTPQNPIKDRENLLDDELRLKMIEMAIEDCPHFKVSTIEFELPKPSYTINTLEEFSKRYDDREFFLLIGADNWLIFHKWYESQKIIKNYGIYIYPRRGHVVYIDPEYTNIKSVNAPIIEVSSTFIRDSLYLGKNMRYFLSSKVYDFVKKNNLYSKSYKKHVQ